MTMMEVQVYHNMPQEMTLQLPQEHTLQMDEDEEFSIEQLFNLYMEASKEVTNAKELLNRTSPIDAFYNDVRAIHETMQLKRDNYQLMIVKHARKSKGSLEYLKKLGAKSETFTTTTSAVKNTNGHANKTNGTQEVSVPVSQESDDIPLAVHSTNVNAVHGGSSSGSTPQSPATTKSVRPREPSPVTTVPQTNQVTGATLNHNGNAETATSSSSSSSSSSSTPSTPTLATSSTEKPHSSSSLPPSLPSKTALPSTTDNRDARNSPTYTEESNSETSPEPTSSTTSIPTVSSTYTEPTETDKLVAPLLNTSHTKTYTSDDIAVIIKAIGEMSIQVTQAQKFIVSILEQHKNKAAVEVVARISSLITAPSKESYGTENDVRYFVVDEVLKIFSTRQDVLDLIAAHKTSMMRVGNWLRWEQRQKTDDDSSARCLSFFEALKCTTRQLSDFKVLDVVSRVAKKENEVSPQAQKILDDAAAKQSMLNSTEKRSFSVSDYVTQTKRKASATLEVTDAGITLNEANPAPKEPTMFTGEVKSILKAPNSSGTKKSVKFRSDDTLVEVKFFESDRDSVHHTVQEDQDKARLMDMDEGRLLKGHEPPVAAAATAAAPSVDGVSEIELAPWFEPPLVSFDIGDAFKKSDASVTRGGTLPFEPFETNFPKATVPFDNQNESPFEPEGLVTPHLIYQYFDDGSSTLVSTGPAPVSPIIQPTVVGNGLNVPPAQNSEPIDHHDTRKRDREADVWMPEHEQTKKPRVDDHGSLSRRLRDDDADANLPQPHRHGFLGANPSNPPVRSRVALPPQESTTNVRDSHPSELTPTIIKWRLNDVREKVRKGAHTIPAKIHSEACSYFPKCRWGNSCHYIHLMSRSKPEPTPAPSSKRSRRRL